MEEAPTQLRISSQWVIDLVYDTLECLHSVLTENQLNYTICFGTALGAQRHGGLIPWDDDADIAILLDDEQKLLLLKPIFEKRGFSLEECFLGYNLHHITRAGRNKTDDGFYPYVDIFILRDTGSSYEYDRQEALTFWSEKPLPYGSFNRLIDVSFGHLTVRGLNEDDARCHLHENYGSDWNNIAWRQWDHFLNKNSPNIRIPLTTDESRRHVKHSNHQQRPFKLIEIDS